MKRILLLLAILATAVTQSWAYINYDFSEVCSTGQILYYKFWGAGSVQVAAPQYDNDGNGLYRGYTMPTGDLVIPSSVTHSGTTYAVVSIGSSAFFNCQGLTSVTIPSSVTSIGTNAFKSCADLTSVSIPNSVTYIGPSAFEYCSGLTSVTIPNNVSHIFEKTFYYCTSLTSVSIPNSITYIGSSAFCYCSGLTSVTIPNNISTIGSEAFCRCTGLTSVTIPNSVIYIGSHAFNLCTGLASVSIGSYVTSIGSGAFYGCAGLTSVTIPNSVTSIGSNAFYGCTGLNTVSIGFSVTSVGSSAFYGCSNVNTLIYNARNCSSPIGINPSTIIIGDRVDTIPQNAIIGYSIDTIISKRNIAPILYPNAYGSSYDIPVFIPCGSSTSYNSRWVGFSNFVELLTNTISVSSSDETQGFVDILTQPTCSTPATITATPNEGYRFDHWSDGDTNNPRSVAVVSDTTIVAYFVSNDSVGTTFEYSDTNNLVLRYEITSIDNHTCKVIGYTSSLPSTVYVPSLVRLHGEDYDVVSIGDSAFKSCSLVQSITIPSSITSIGAYAFASCSNLSAITLPSSVTTIGLRGLSECPSLTSIILPDSLAVLEDYLLYYNSSLTSITLPSRLTTIDDNAFGRCAALRSIDLPTTITNMGNNVFNGCSLLDSVVIPTSVTSMGTYVFRNCTSLTNAVLSDNIRLIPTGTFSGCSALASVVLPASATTVSTLAFNGCSSIQSLELPERITSIGSDAFKNCTSLQSITLPASLNSIANSAFSGCSNLGLIISAKATAPTAGTYAFTSVPTTCRVRVPCGATESYQALWHNFGIIEETSPDFSITLNSEDDAQGSVALTQAPSCGDSTAVVYATPFEGFVFNHWSDGSTDNPHTIFVTSDTTVTAYFISSSTRVVYIHDTITVNNYIHVTTTIHDTTIVNNYIHDTIDRIVNNYIHDTTIVNNYIHDTVETVVHDTAYVTLLLRDYTIIYGSHDTLYVRDTVYDCHNQQLVILVNNDTLGACAGAGSYPLGSTVQIMAIPRQGTRFLCWSDGNVRNPRTVVLTGDLTFTAIFEQREEE